MKVGDYVRTKDGLIRKIVEIDKLIYIDKGYISDEPEYHNSLIEEEITKSSPNIIDLIEVGDYVNGFRVECDDFLGEHIVIFESEERKYKRLYLNKIYIKSIVTKEQFESMQYNLESEVN